MSELIEQAITEFYGERCDDYLAECVVCQAWAQYDVLNLALRVLTEQMAVEVKQWKPKKEQA